jgi:hypothetical protein
MKAITDSKQKVTFLYLLCGGEREEERLGLYNRYSSAGDLRVRKLTIFLNVK